VDDLSYPQTTLIVGGEALAEFVGAVAAGFLYSVLVSGRTTTRAVAPKQAVRTHTAPEGARS
jgi:hypothetical protein